MRQPAPTAFAELQRIFGSEHVSEEFTAHSEWWGAPQDKWCYVVTVPPDSDLLVRQPSDNYDFYHMGSRLDDLLVDRLRITKALDNKIKDDLPTGNYVQEDAPNYVPYFAAPAHPLRFLLVVDQMEDAETIADLQSISREAVRHALSSGLANGLHGLHCHTLRHATHGIHWEFISNHEGEFYQTTRRIQNPDALQMAILATLKKDEDDYIPSHDGKARISFDAMNNGRLPALMEAIVPRSACALVRKGGISRLP